MKNIVAEQKRERADRAVVEAKKILKKGDKVTVTSCPGTKRWIVFECWDGCWMVSKSGRDDYHPVTISKINGKSVDLAGDNG